MARICCRRKKGLHSHNLRAEHAAQAAFSRNMFSQSLFLDKKTYVRIYSPDIFGLRSVHSRLSPRESRRITAQRSARIPNVSSRSNILRRRSHRNLTDFRHPRMAVLHTLPRRTIRRSSPRAFPNNQRLNANSFRNNSWNPLRPRPSMVHAGTPQGSLARRGLGVSEKEKEKESHFHKNLTCYLLPVFIYGKAAISVLL